MLTFAIVLAFVSTAFEAMVAVRSRSLRRMATRRVSVNLGVSLGLSLVLGVLFGAVGLIALTAGLLSTLLSIPVYRFLHWNFDSPEAERLGGNRLLGKALQVRQTFEQAMVRLWARLSRARQLLIAPVRFVGFLARLLDGFRSLRRR